MMVTGLFSVKNEAPFLCQNDTESLKQKRTHKIFHNFCMLSMKWYRSLCLVYILVVVSVLQIFDCVVTPHICSSILSWSYDVTCFVKIRASMFSETIHGLLLAKITKSSYHEIRTVVNAQQLSQHLLSRLHTLLLLYIMYSVLMYYQIPVVLSSQTNDKTVSVEFQAYISVKNWALW